MGKKIMCVDDSRSIRTLIDKTLAPEGYTILEAENGQEALDKLSSEVALFIVDVNMPVMDGFTFVEKLKSLTDYQAKPVVFLTTESSTEKKRRGKELGVNGWIVKPFESESLKKIVSILTG